MRTDARTRNLIGLLMIVIVILLYLCYQVISPKIRELRSQESILEKEVSSAQSKFDSLVAAKNQLTQLDDLVDKINLAVPKNRDYPSIILSVNSIGSRNGVLIANISPENSYSYSDQDLGNYGAEEIAFSVSASGTYQQLKAFTSDLGGNLRLMNIKGITLSSSLGDSTINSTESVIQAVFNLVAYTRSNNTADTGEEVYGP